MPLPLTNLDTRRWDDLVEEARAMIPRYARGWTDHNLHDPGITLIQLLAWLVELDVYQLNRVPEAHRRKFLALVGVHPRPPHAAELVLGFAPPGPNPVDVPEGAEFITTAAESGALTFSAIESLHAVPTTLSAILIQSDANVAPVDFTRHWREQGSFTAFGNDPTPGAALWLGFDRALPKGKTVRIAFAFGGSRSGPDERWRIIQEESAREEACRRRLPPTPPCATTSPPTSATKTEPLQHHSVKLVWEFYASGKWRTLDLTSDALKDDTRALTLDGSVEFKLPDDMSALDAGTAVPSYYLRARVESGDYDAPPLVSEVIVNALHVVQAVPMRQAFTIQAGVISGGTVPTVPGQARFKMKLDASGVITDLAFVSDESVPEQAILFYHAATPTNAGAIILDLIWLGQSDGTPNQVLVLPLAHVDADSLELFSLESSTAMDWRAWQVQRDFDASTARDLHVHFDATRARIIFGDGNQGRIPPAGTPVLARYRATAADAGNIRASQTLVLAPSLNNWLLFDSTDFQNKVAALGLYMPLAAAPAQVWKDKSRASYTAMTSQLGTIINPRPAVNGATAETLAHAAGRAVEMLQAPTRAITADDYESLTLETPGTVIARAHALPGRHPSYPCLAAPGLVTVIIVPAQRRRRAIPSAGLIAAVRRYLSRRRLLGTHVEVVGPRYVTVQVTARVKSLPGASRTRVQADVIAALNTFLHPLTGGPASILPAPRDDHYFKALTPPGINSSPLPPGLSLMTQSTPPPSPLLPAMPSEPGWPFGRDVYRSEILQVIDGVAGVDNVLSLELSSDGGEAQCGNLCLGPTDLAVSGTHSIEVV